MMKKILLILAAFLFLGLSTQAFAAVGSSNLTEELKVRRFCILDYQEPTTSESTIGQDGIIFALSINSIMKFSGTSSIATLPYSAAIKYDILDNSAGSGLNCTGVTIRGFDQFGVNRRHTDTLISSNARTTSVAFSVISGIDVTGCTGANNAGDIVRFYADGRLGLGLKIRDYTDVESACLNDFSGQEAAADGEWKCAELDDTVSDTADIRNAVSTTYHTINVNTAIFGVSSEVAADDGDDLCWTVRPSF